MTILVGCKCSDGVVIGSDSAVTSAAIPGHAVMTEVGASKIEIPFNNEPLIVASTGSVGMSLRFVHELRSHWNQQQSHNLHQFLRNNPIKFPTEVAAVATENFRRAFSPVMNNPQIGFGIGALMGYVARDEAHLVEFDCVQFQPDLKGVSDGNGAWRTKPYATMGSGQQLGDPFMAEAHCLLFGKEFVLPTLAQGRVAVTWTLNHVLKYNIGMIGGAMQLAAIQKHDDRWTAEIIDAGECQNVIEQIEEHMRGFWDTLEPPAATVEQALGGN